MFWQRRRAIAAAGTTTGTDTITVTGSCTSAAANTTRNLPVILRGSNLAVSVAARASFCAAVSVVG
jgi:hypothetical protein